MVKLYLRRVDLSNTISTFDALNAQGKTIKAIVEKGGNYVVAVKENQKSLYKDIKYFFNDKALYEEASNESYYEEIEKRIYIMTSKIDWLSNKDKWKNIKSIGIVKRKYEKDTKKVVDIRYCVKESLKRISNRNFILLYFVN